MVIAAWQSILDVPFFPPFRTRSRRFPALCSRIIRSVISRHAHHRAEHALFYRDKYRSGFFRLRYVWDKECETTHTNQNRAVSK